MSHLAVAADKGSETAIARKKPVAEYTKRDLLQEALGVMVTAFAVFDISTGRQFFANRAFTDAFEQRSSGPIDLESLGTSLGQNLQVDNAHGETALVESRPNASRDFDAFNTASGKWYSVETSRTKIDGRDALVVIAKDTTDRILSEQKKNSQRQQLIFTSKVMSVGEMAATLAHELNQPIGSVLNYLSGSIRRLDSTNFRKEHLVEPLAEAHRQAQRAASIIERIRQFVRSREPKMDRLDLHEVIRAVLTTLEPEIKRHVVKVQTHMPDDLPTVCADRVMIEQVVHNLTKNAVEAMQTQTGVKHLLYIEASAVREGTVEIRVRDNGPGLSGQARDQIFSPFFSTKSDGLGIGLNICRSLVEYHGGSLVFSNNASGGSTFSFTLPVAD
jgi:C4-dicarboxylate-specific signal transduction histidine kinase